ncbi:MAG: sulfite oxidase, partial [Curvibacter sp.]
TELRAGSHVLACRVTDVDGREQPRLRTDNAGGFANNSWLDHAIKVQVG